MKILVIGGMHGNEPLGIEIVSRLNALALNNVDTILANPRAIKQRCRFVEVDLNRSFPGNDTSYEAKRAAEIVRKCASYDLVIDFHNTHCPDNDCSFVGDSANELLFDVSEWLGLKRTIVADYDCLNKFAPNCISVEISLTSTRMDSGWWVDKINALSKLATLPGARDIERFRFVYRMTLDDAKRLRLMERNLKAFKAMSATLARDLSVDTPAYPIFIGDKYTPYNFGGIVNKINV